MTYIVDDWWIYHTQNGNCSLKNEILMSQKKIFCLNYTFLTQKNIVILSNQVFCLKTEVNTYKNIYM